MARDPAGEDHPGHHAHAVGGEHPGDVELGETGELGHGRGDEGVHREHAAETDGADEQGQPHLRLVEGTQLAPHGCVA
jgi:hypothetical protein